MLPAPAAPAFNAREFGTVIASARRSRLVRWMRNGGARDRCPGIVAQLGISAHLLLVGFPDAWCAHHIRLHVARSLAYANVSGFGHDCPEMARLAIVLDPYWKWNHMHSYDRPAPDDGGFTVDQVRSLLRALLDHVRIVTGVPDREV